MCSDTSSLPVHMCSHISRCDYAACVTALATFVQLYGLTLQDRPADLSSSPGTDQSAAAPSPGGGAVVSAMKQLGKMSQMLRMMSSAKVEGVTEEEIEEALSATLDGSAEPVEQ